MKRTTLDLRASGVSISVRHPYQNNNGDVIQFAGAGKTTLLNALSGRATYAKVTGSLTLAGRALASDDLNYVPQFDDLNEAFSSRELLTHMRLLKVSCIMVEGGLSRYALWNVLDCAGLLPEYHWYTCAAAKKGHGGRHQCVLRRTRPF